MNKRKQKNKKFHSNKIKKRMRQLRKKTSTKAIRRKNNGEVLVPLDVFEFLKERQFEQIPVKERAFVNNRKGTAYIEIPSIFSMTKNCEETIQTLKKVFYCGQNPNIHSIVFLHHNCTELEIAASTIMDTIVIACKAYRREKGDSLNISGDLPRDAKAKKIFIASGLPSHLNLKEKITYRKDNFLPFHIVAGKSGTGRSGTVSTHLTNYIDDCLKTRGYGLTPLGQNRISKMFGEVIDNCEIHGGDKSTWYVLGHFDMMEKDVGEMNLVIFNYGNSIYERLLSEETTDETKSKICRMKEVHYRKYDDNWNEETMLTVFALQQGISRLRNSNSEGDKNRGMGTVVLMDTFYLLGNTVKEDEPEFSITSGRTHIIFNKKYCIEDKKIDDPILGNSNRKVIAFNKENNILDKADKENVYYMQNEFPGTVIAMKFYVDDKHLKRVKEGNNE